MIAYDGERTEAEYFKGWSRRLGTRSGVVLKPFYVASGGNALSAAREAYRRACADGDFDELWCVCDADDTPRADLQAAIEYAKSIGMRLCVSTRCFEVWLALHWERISLAAIQTEAQAIALVRRHHSRYGVDGKHVPFSELHPRVGDACRNATWLRERDLANPATNVDELVEMLLELDKKVT
jgi:hypothetical protein